MQLLQQQSNSPQTSFKMWFSFLLAMLFAVIMGTPVSAQNAVAVGSGSYADSVPTADLQTDSYYALPCGSGDLIF